MENHDQKLHDEIVGYAARDIAKALDGAIVNIANAMIQNGGVYINDAIREALRDAEDRIIRELRGVGDDAIPALGRWIKEQREEQH